MIMFFLKKALNLVEQHLKTRKWLTVTMLLLETIESVATARD